MLSRRHLKRKRTGGNVIAAYLLLFYLMPISFRQLPILHLPFATKNLKLRQSLHRLCGYARKQLLNALKRVPDGILCVDKSVAETHDHGLLSPIIPIFTPRASHLTDYLLKKGTALQL
jgi:8-amino-7-oxononanoate synthase